MRSFSHLNGNLVTLESRGLFNILILFKKCLFFHEWSHFICLRPCSLHETTLGQLLDLVGRDATVLPGEKKNVQLNQVQWRHAIAHGQSDRSPLMNATPSLSSASAVTVATPLWPAAQQCPLTPRRVDLWPEGHQAGSGGHLLLEDSKSTSLIGYHLPFPYPHLCNWHIDQLALCTLLAAPYPVYIVSEAGVWDVYTPFCKGLFVCMKQSWVWIYEGGRGQISLNV